MANYAKMYDAQSRKNNAYKKQFSESLMKKSSLKKKKKKASFKLTFQQKCQEHERIRNC